MSCILIRVLNGTISCWRSLHGKLDHKEGCDHTVYNLYHITWRFFIPLTCFKRILRSRMQQRIVYTVLQRKMGKLPDELCKDLCIAVFVHRNHIHSKNKGVNFSLSSWSEFCFTPKEWKFTPLRRQEPSHFKPEVLKYSLFTKSELISQSNSRTPTLSWSE